MARLPFDPRFEDLPGELAIFPLPGALLLPSGRLPLNIFEPRYLSMIEDALKAQRLIGMIQPRGEARDIGSADTYGVGCVGRIVEFSETDDGRFVISLAGLIRFRLAEELPKAPGGYRRVRPDYSSFAQDMVEKTETIDRPALEAQLKSYFQKSGMKADWASIKRADDESLITTLSMLMPFQPSEKQALLEAPDLQNRAQTLGALLALASHGEDENETPVVKN